MCVVVVGGAGVRIVVVEWCSDVEVRVTVVGFCVGVFVVVGICYGLGCAVCRIVVVIVGTRVLIVVF